MHRAVAVGKHRNSKVALSITALRSLSGHLAPSVFARMDGFCSPRGHATTITSKRLWQHRTSSLTKDATTNRASPPCVTQTNCVHEVAVCYFTGGCLWLFNFTIKHRYAHTIGTWNTSWFNYILILQTRATSEMLCVSSLLAVAAAQAHYSLS